MRRRRVFDSLIIQQAQPEGSILEAMCNGIAAYENAMGRKPDQIKAHAETIEKLRVEMKDRIWYDPKLTKAGAQITIWGIPVIVG